ncbi:MAG: MBL fold metallo-hydrolase [Hyphomicrobium sp.]|jgi:glyoxylase-like metal-dependent hydrolase (beta-lactamase superfamily II)
MKSAFKSAIIFSACVLANGFAAPVLAGEADTPNVGAVAYKVGGIEVVAVHDNHYTIPNDGKTFGLGAGPEAVGASLRALGVRPDSITVQFGGLLVKDGKRLILIDTGAGPSLNGGMIDSLKLAGVAPDQITDVLLTHSHFDHVGGLAAADGKSAFPNAKVRMTSKEWAFMQASKDRAAVASAIAAQVETFEPGARISDHVTAVPVTGHTPGHTGYEIVAGETKLLDIGDTAHSSIVSLAHPEWAIGFDSDQTLGAESRIALLKRLSQSQEVIFAPHFPFPSLGRVKAQGQGYMWEPVSGSR